ncbi:hypothetical protein GCM10010492_44440 [Saccharothrix mutabilis subsp. mutabilis]|uniref:Uncharacterized protein n=1 Tax=Saccharothrix mutabilis subsp. mutabilis TaxID=66855 RepID=A0ABP3DUW7_9PSEU
MAGSGEAPAWTCLVSKDQDMHVLLFALGGSKRVGREGTGASRGEGKARRRVGGAWMARGP